MKQTAVEFIIEIFSKEGLVTDLWSEEIEQAKEMEKQQIVDAYEDGYSDSDNTFELNKQYYNETFNK